MMFCSVVFSNHLFTGCDVAGLSGLDVELELDFRIKPSEDLISFLCFVLWECREKSNGHFVTFFITNESGIEDYEVGGFRQTICDTDFYE